MDVGIGPTIRYHRDQPRPLVDVYDEFFDELLLGDELGYSHIWLPEHHFADDAHNPSALPLLAALARQTTRARLGTYILLLAFHNPLLVAEDAAVVDILSHGRLDLAVGAGPMDQECQVFGVPRSETYARTYEALQVIQKAWTEEEFSHHGKYYHYDNVRVTTKPVQQPHPPVYMAAMGPQSATRAAKRGYHSAMAMGPSHNVYVDALHEAGRDPGRASLRLRTDRHTPCRHHRAGVGRGGGGPARVGVLLRSARLPGRQRPAAGGRAAQAELPLRGYAVHGRLGR